MTQIDFYILPEGGDAAALDYVARLALKVFRRGHRLYVHTTDTAQTEAVSQAFWQRPEGFLAHTTEAASQLPVVISDAGSPGDHDDILLNMDSAIPEHFSRFQRVLEVVPANPEARRLSREHYQYYRDRGFPIKTHKL